MMLGSWRAGLALAARYESISGEAVRAAAAKYLSPDLRSVVTLVPVEEVAS
jgi:zinc protease